MRYKTTWSCFRKQCRLLESYQNQSINLIVAVPKTTFF